MDDVEEIKKLKARYFRTLDSKDWDLYEAGFATDIVVDLTRAGGQRFEGRDAFMAYAKGMAIVQSIHHGHMPEIDLTGPESATGVWALEDYNIWEDSSQNHGWATTWRLTSNVMGIGRSQRWRCLICEWNAASARRR